MSNSKTILVIGNPSYAGAILVCKLLKAGHRVKVPNTFVCRDDTHLSEEDWHTICSANSTVMEDYLYNGDNLNELILGCKVIIYLAKEKDKHNNSSNHKELMSMVNTAKVSGVGRFIYVLDSLEQDDSFKEHLKSLSLDNFTIIIFNSQEARDYVSQKKIKMLVDILTKSESIKHKITLYNKKQLKAGFCDTFSDKWYIDRRDNSPEFYINGITDTCLYLSVQPLKKIQKKIWPYVVICKIFLNRFYIMHKFYQMLKKPYIPFVGRIKLIKRLFDVSSMMFMVHLWPQQAYRFSTRKCLPSKAVRFRKNSKYIIPYELIESRTSDIPKMEEINIVMRGASFDLEKLQNLDSPIFLASFWEPVKTKKDVTYITAGAENALRFGKMGYKVIHLETNSKDCNGNITPDSGSRDNLWYNQFIDGINCKRIAMLEKVYRLSKPLSPFWAPTGSGFPSICALSYFAKKINVYGWDFYLNSSPKDMTYWQLYFNLYRLKLDIFRSRNHLESAIVNFYYGYELSKLPNFNIHGYLGQLGKHQKLMNKLEKILFNTSAKGRP